MAVSFGRPWAMACMSGERENIRGNVRFYPFRAGILVVADIRGLPSRDGVFAFHIHEGDCCAGEGFPLTGGHYNPEEQPHPYHAGDLPPLFSNNGCAFTAVYTTRFSLSEILGRAVVIHGSPDDFTTHPFGAAGEKSAWGIIRRV